MGTSADGTPLRPRRQRDPVKPLPDFVDLIATLRTMGKKNRLRLNYLRLLKRSGNWLRQNGEIGESSLAGRYLA